MTCASAARRPSSRASLLSLVNPKGYAAMAALYSGFVLVPDRMGADVAIKMAVLDPDHRRGQYRLAAGGRGA